MADTRTMWRQRVTGWRASGLTAQAYGAQHGFAANTLRWWSSRLAHEEPRAVATPVVRFAQVVRASSDESEKRGAIVLEIVDARMRLTADAQADRETVARVVELMLDRRAQ